MAEEDVNTHRQWLYKALMEYVLFLFFIDNIVYSWYVFSNISSNWYFAFIYMCVMIL